ncbi:alternative oxidase [Sporobolomyces salmoneus]|uniref:alternative oxidase n=1 Tax=Sporobolomyces salmoneus TaxID=183962 RepID=UPI003179DBD9
MLSPTTLQLGRSRLLLASTRSLPVVIRHPSTLSFSRLASTSTPPHEHSYQPHPNDLKSSSSSPEGPSPPPQSPWRPSRPHEQYLLSHPVYTQNDVEAVKVLYLPPKTLGEKIARLLVDLSRKGFDFVTRYKHATPEAAEKAMKEAGKEGLSLKEKRDAGFAMSLAQWESRILFLESIAGVPGFTAAILRHLRSLRLMKRDYGVINTLLAEAENERMHLLTFMKIAQPSAFFRLMVLGAQGVFFNLFFLAALLSPRSAHRFVAYLEEEACYTYTHAIEALERGEIPEWEEGKQKVPTIAKDYWRLGDNATMKDLLLAVRADEAGHRFVNHTLANLNPDDPNPVAMKHASPIEQGNKPGMTREESFAWLEEVEREMRGDKLGGVERDRK